MKLYRVLTRGDSTEFRHKVSEALSKGRGLYGDPAYANDEKVRVMRCGQAVIDEVSVTYSPDLTLGVQ